MNGSGLELCPTCGVPLELTRQCLWLNSGVIVLGTDMMRRQCLIESENLDPIFQMLEGMGIGDILSLAIEAARTRRASRTREAIPPEVRAMLRNRLLQADVFYPVLRADTRFRGFGDFELLEFMLEGEAGDRSSMRVTNIYSKPLFLGAFAGLCDAFLDSRVCYALHDLSDNVCNISVIKGEPEPPSIYQFEEAEYCHRDGDVELERCGDCEAPAALAGLTWDVDAGIIRNAMGPRMVLLDPQILDLIVKEVEKRSDQAAPAIVEAQRRFVLDRFQPDRIPGTDRIREALAVRGLGNLKEFEVDSHALRMRIENAACHLLVAGSAQALFDGTHDGDSKIDWKLLENGELIVAVKPR
jgi:hypothetical protein